MCHVLSLLPTLLRLKCLYYPHFTDEEKALTEAEPEFISSLVIQSPRSFPYAMRHPGSTLISTLIKSNLPYPSGKGIQMV